MKQKRPIILGVIIFILAVAWFATGVLAAILLVRTPLGEPLLLAKQQAPTIVPTLAPTIVSPAAIEAPSMAPAKNQSAINSPKPAETCGNSGSLDVLFVGEDFSKGQWPLGADAVRVAKFNFSDKTITVVAFPRDLWVKTPGLANQNYAETTLGLSYYYKKQATNGADKHKVTVATEMIAQALYDNFGLILQDYYTLQLDSTAQMIDTIGGIDIDSPAAITTEYGEFIPAGQQTMNGHTAVEYVRTFVQGDAARIQRQNLFLKALQNKMISANILPRVPDLYKQFDKSIVTDLSPKQLYDLACLANAVPQQQISFYEIGGDLVIKESDGVLVPKVEPIKAKLKEWLGE